MPRFPISRPLTRSLAAAAFLALVAGCVTVRYSEGNAIQAERIAQIQPGVTRKAEVLEWFGAPQTFNTPDMLRQMLEDQFTPTELVTLPFQDAMAWQFSQGTVDFAASDAAMTDE